MLVGNYLYRLNNIPGYFYNSPKLIKINVCIVGRVISHALLSKHGLAVRLSLGLAGVALIALFLRRNSPQVPPSPPVPPRPIPVEIQQQGVLVSRGARHSLLEAIRQTPIFDGALFVEWLDQLQLFSINGEQVKESMTSLEFLCLMLEDSYESPDQMPLFAQMLGHAYRREVKRLVGIRTEGFNLIEALNQLPYPTSCPELIIKIIFEQTRSYEILARLQNPPENIRPRVNSENLPQLTLTRFYEIVYTSLGAEKNAVQGELRQTIAGLSVGAGREEKFAMVVAMINQLPRDQASRSHHLEGCSAIILTEIIRKAEPAAAVALIQDNNLNIEDEFSCPITLSLFQDPMRTDCCKQDIDGPSWQPINGCCPFCRARGSTISRNDRVRTILDLSRRAGLIPS